MKAPSASPASLVGPSAILRRAVDRLAIRVLDLEMQLPASWPDYVQTVGVLAALVAGTASADPPVAITTAEMAKRMGLTAKTLLRAVKAGAIRPVIQRGKLYRWSGGERLR